jgi:hypothetical protein
MPLGGETVGTAFVRIIADGEGLDESIRDVFDDSDPAFEESARRNTAAYAKGWEAEWKKQPNQKKLTDGIRNTLLAGDFLQSSFFRDRAWTRFKSGMANTFGEAGKLAVLRLEQELLRGETSLDQLGDRVSNMLGDVARANTELFEESRRMEKEMLDDAYKMNVEFDRKIGALREQQDADFLQSNRLRISAIRLLEQRYQEIIDDTERLAKGERTLYHSKHDLIIALREYRDETEAAGGATREWEVEMANLHKRVRLMTPGINRFNAHIGKLGDGLGRAFGRGSRNDFLNFFGSMVRGLVGLLTLIPRIVGMFIQLGQSIKYAFDETMRNTGSTFRAAMAAVIATLETAGAAAGAMAVGLGLIVLVIGPLVSIMLALAGAVSAIIGSLAFGLTAALVAVGGALVPLIAGIGVVVAGFQSLDKAQKKVLENNFKPVVDQFKELGEIAADELFLDMAGNASVLAGVLEGMRPTVRGIARAIRGVFDEFVDGLQSPFFFQFMQAMEVFLPNAVRLIGEAFNNFFFGFLGFFQASAPLINRFLEWLLSISNQFREWTNSKAGRDEIRDFLRTAGDSAAALGQFLGDAVYFLGQLFTAGQGTGDSLILTLGDKLREWGDFIKENPDAIGKFFEDAQKTAEEVGRIVEEVGRLIDTLDSERTRSIGSDLLRTIEVSLKGIGIAAQIAYTPIYLLTETLKGMHRIGERIGDFFRAKFPSSMAEARNAANTFRTRAVEIFTALPGQILSAMGALGDKIRAKFYEGLDDIAKIPGIIVGYFQGLGARIAAAIGSINIDWPSPPSWMSKYLGGGFEFPFAAGGVVYGPTRALIGEAGAEAVVPLNRPLSQVDPAVRWLSALAQGKETRMASGGVVGSGKTIDASGWIIQSNSEDSKAVAEQVVNRLVASGY